MLCISPVVLLIACVFAEVLSAPLVQAAIITVNTYPSGSGCTIIDAINSANGDAAVGGCLLSTTGTFGDDTIILPPTNNIHTLFEVNNTGPFGDTGLPIIHSNIIIEGNNGFIQRSSYFPTPHFRLFYVSTDGTLTLRNLKLRNGVADDGNPSSDSSLDNGSAIFNYGGTVTLENVAITGNTSGTPFGKTIINVSIGVYGAELTVDTSLIADNIGLGIESTSQGTVTSDSVLMIRDSAVSTNTGIGISANSGVVQIIRSEISGNQQGGILTGNDVTMTVRDTTISGNQRSSSGGGVDIEVGSGSSQVSLINVTITDNTATDGGGILQALGTLNLVNTIVSGNNTISGSGREIQRTGSALAGKQYNNLFGYAGITKAQALSGFTTETSDITATSDGSNPTPLANILLPLAKNGGPTQTHALVLGSPAVNAAVTTYSNGFIVLPGEGCASIMFIPFYQTVYRNDQRGLSRPQKQNCDIGAYEMKKKSFYVIPLPRGKAVIFEL